MTVLDIIFKFATVLIAAFNVFFAVKIFRFKDRKDDKEKERDRKIQLLKTLVLDHSLEKYYSIFEEMEKELSALKQEDLAIHEKAMVERKISGLFIQLRAKFYDSLLAIDVHLYESIKTEADLLQNAITETIFDPGVNLTHTPKFDELISNRTAITKTEIIKKLFHYRG